MVKAGVEDKKIDDFKLTRYACQLIAQNGDRKGISEKEDILDYISSTELVANLFRITQIDEV